jgi:hypothetical protein
VSSAYTLVLLSGFSGIAIAVQAAPGDRLPSGTHAGGVAGAPVHRRPPDHGARELRRRAPDEVRALRRRHRDEVGTLRRPAMQPLAPRLPEGRTAPEPLVAGGYEGAEEPEQSRTACRLGARTVCLLPGAGTITLWCARRHLVFEVPRQAPARSATCPESAIEAVWLRDPGARSPTRIEPGPCPAEPACGNDPAAPAR